MTDIKKVRTTIRNHYNNIYGDGWWKQVEDWLKEHTNYPKTHKLDVEQETDFHPVFRGMVRSAIPTGEFSASRNRLVAWSRSNLLRNMRVGLLPQWLGILSPEFRSRSVGNFGLVGMKPDSNGNGIFSRAYYNIPFVNQQKIKRLIIEAYGVSKHGKDINQIDRYIHGGVDVDNDRYKKNIFLLSPDRDENFEKLAKHTDYTYVTLNYRFPGNYREYIQTLDGSVLLSEEASKKLKYKIITQTIIKNPHPDISKKILFFKKKEPREYSRIGFQEPLSKAYNENVETNTSPIDGYISKAALLTPKARTDEKKVWMLTIEDERNAEIGVKLESPCGLKHTCGGFVKDKSPVMVINPEMLEDRALYYELRETGKIHCYIAQSGRDSNISNRNVSISKTFMQGLMAYPEKVRDKIKKQVFNEDNLVFGYPHKLLDIVEKVDEVDPDKLLKKYPVFYNHFYYIRQIGKGGKTYLSVEPTRAYTAIKQANKKGFNNIPNIHKSAIHNFVKSMIQKLIIIGKEKKTGIKMNGVQRIILFDDLENVNHIKVSKKLYERLGKPSYVLTGKEPISRHLSLRCMEVKIDKELEDQVVRIHPFFGKDYMTGEFHTKADSQPSYSPITIKDGKQIKSMCMEELFDKYQSKWVSRSDGKEISVVNRPIQIMTEKGWKRIYYVIRHKVNKKCYRVWSKNHWTDVTKDHSLIIDGKQCKPENSTGKDFTITGKDYSQKYDLDKDVAWLYGLFAAEGFCNIYYRNNGKKGDSRYEFTISNMNKETLEKGKNALRKMGFDSLIKLYNSNHGVHILTPVKDKKTPVTLFRELFYSKDEKKLPDFILESNNQTMEACLSGFVEGDGHIYENGKFVLSTKSHVLASQLTYILQRLGHQYYISCRKDKPQIIEIHSITTNGEYENPKKGYSDKVREKAIELRKDGLTQKQISKKLKCGEATISRWLNNGIGRKTGNKFQKNRDKINHIMEIPQTEYVYDVTTETGTFTSAQVLLKQTDGDLAQIIPIKEKIPELMYNKKKVQWKKLWKDNKYNKIEDVPHWTKKWTGKELLTNLYAYSRNESIEQLLVQTIGGNKNQAMWSELVNNTDNWREFLKDQDIETKIFQAEKMVGYKPTLEEEADAKAELLKEVRGTDFPEKHPYYDKYIGLESSNYYNRKEVKDVLKGLKKTGHPIMELLYHTFKALKII